MQLACLLRLQARRPQFNEIEEKRVPLYYRASDDDDERNEKRRAEKAATATAAAFTEVVLKGKSRSSYYSVYLQLLNFQQFQRPLSTSKAVVV